MIVRTRWSRSSSLALALAAASGGCGTDPIVCPDESVALTAVVVNLTLQNFPTLTVRDTVIRTGRVLDVGAEHPTGSLAAGGSTSVVVFSDLFEDAIRASGEAVAVAVIAGGLSTSARYEFGTDGCNVRKVAGPDTLTIQAAAETPSAHAVVQGRVTTRTGDPVVGATLDLTATGQATGEPIATGTASTGADGSYSVALHADAPPPQIADLDVTVHGPLGAGFADRTVTASSLTFGAADPAPDTLSLTVSLELQGMAGLLYEILPCGLPPFGGPYECPDTMEVSPGDSLLIGHAVIDTSGTHEDILIRPACAVNLEILLDGQVIEPLPIEPTCPDSVEVNGFNAPQILNVRGYSGRCRPWRPPPIRFGACGCSIRWRLARPCSSCADLRSCPPLRAADVRSY